MTQHHFRSDSVLPGVIGAIIIAAIVFYVFSPSFLSDGDTTKQPHPTITEERKTPLPTIEDIQRRVGATPDGKLGPETQDKWERALCDQFAAESFKKAGTNE